MFYGIGVGVGKSKGLTQKAIEVLSSLDILYVPTAKKENTYSFAYEVVKEYLSKNTIIKERHFPMNYNSLELNNAWNIIADEIESDVISDKKVGFVTIGDPMIYSTYIYIFKLLKNRIKVCTISGISSFADIASNNNFPLVEGENPLIILPATIGSEKLKKYIKEETSLVIMKVYRNFNEIIEILKDEGLEDCCIIVSNSSQDNEKIYTDLNNLTQDNISYFTTILINKELKGK